MVNMDDEQEYLDFYDFTKTYENHPLAIKQTVPVEESKIKEEESGEEDEGSWEDCDAQSLGSADQSDPEPESSKGFSIEESKKAQTESDFEILNAPSMTSGTDAKFKVRDGANGKTREEVILGLNVKKAELLSTGEVKLGNGRILGTRKWHYLYK